MATIKDVARKAKVSIGTVDRVVHNRGRVSTNTIIRVRKVINELGYRPNLYARNLSLSKSYCIAVLMPRPEQDSGYWALSEDGIKKAANELKHYHVKIKFYHYDRYSESTFFEQCDKLILSNPDGIMIAPVVWKGVKDFFRMIPEKIPYVLFNANIPDINARSFIGQDAYQSGIVCGKLMSIMLKEKSGIAVILAAYDDYHITERSDGFKHFFGDGKKTKIKIYSLVKSIDYRSFSELMDRIIDENNSLGGIFVANSSTHYVARYLKENYNDKKIYLIGYDLINKNVQYLKEGWIDVLISQKAETQGYEAVYALYNEVILQQPCERNILMPVDIVMKENFVYYM